MVSAIDSWCRLLEFNMPYMGSLKVLIRRSMAIPTPIGESGTIYWHPERLPLKWAPVMVISLIL